MNSYNENLHSSVIATLQSQQQDLKKTESEANASMFALYHAEGALITADDKLLAAHDKSDHDAKVKLEAVRNSNISNNLLASATQANDYLKQSVTNTAVSASNVQVATNAVVKLASDVGSIYSIIQAADFDTNIYRIAKEAGECINETAYDAELASQLALEASVLTASVSGSTVLDKAKSNNGVTNNMLKVVSTAFDTSSQLVATENANLASVSAKEKIAEGVYEDLNIDLMAAREAYESTNRELNINLKVHPVPNKPQSSFIVEFNLLTSPFEKENTPLYYPVKDYYLFVVKNKQQSTFSITEAETILRTTDEKIKAADSKERKRYIPLSALMDRHVHEDEDGKNKFTGKFNHNKISIPGQDIYVLQDTDGQDIQTGTEYVVFILAVFQEEYKAALNSYDDFISAPSGKFLLANHLAVARFTGPQAGPSDSTSDAKNEKGSEESSMQQLWFVVKEHADFKVEYRCVFLPVSDKFEKEDLNNSYFQELIGRITQIEKISDEFGPKIEELEAKVLETRDQIQEMTNGAAVVGIIPKKLHDVFTAHNKNKKELYDALKAKDKLVGEINLVRISPIDFIFNLTIAEQISAGNYITAEQRALLGSKSQKKANNKPWIIQKTAWRVQLEEDTTDNFGNKLIDGHHYIPVILSISTASEDNLSRFVNAFTDFNNTRFFKFKQPK